jgi:D,D-heptose 1,7-bisphosphate phosphatase
VQERVAKDGVRPAAFLDRDGVINVDRGYTYRVEDLVFTRTAIEGIKAFNNAGYRVFVISNQSGVARGYCTVEHVERFHAAMLQQLHARGAHIDGFYYCPFHPEGSVAGYAIDHEDRKPSPGMLLRAMREWPTDIAASVLIGDKQSDLQAAARAGVTGLRVETNVGDLAAAVRRFLQQRPQIAAPLAAIKAYRDWIVEKALPFWADDGFDAQNARFRERLDWYGGAVEVPHRAMVQARQIYVFSHAAELGWFLGGESLAEAAMASLLRDFCMRSGRQASFAFSVGTDGRIVSPVRDAYAHAFVLFALGWLHRLNGDRKLLSLADEVTAFIDEHLVDREHGGLFNQLPITDRSKRQNPHMHLLEAYLALDEAAPGRGYLDRAGALVTLFKERLFSAELGVLREHFSERWADHPDPLKQQIIEPGHHFEWVWLLRRYEERSGENLGPWIAQLYEIGGRGGISGGGLIFDQLALDMNVVKDSHRIWPHTEALKAAVVRQTDGDPLAPPYAGKMAGTLMENFLGRPIAAGWIDHLSAKGRPLVDYIPASSLYHLFLAAAEAERGFGLSGNTSS